MDTSQKIAEALDEMEPGPLKTIERVIKVLGEERALALLEQTQQIEAEGGMLTDDGAQRRSPGGVYFKLVKNQTKTRERWAIFGPIRATAPKAKPQPQPLTWEEYMVLANELLKSTKGEIMTAKLTLIGRPGRVIVKDEVVLTSMQNTKVPSLPKGLPVPPVEPTTYVIYIARKQWNKVREAIQNPQDALIIEGYPVFDPRLKAMSVFAMSVTTKLLQASKREAQSQAN